MNLNRAQRSSRWRVLGFLVFFGILLLFLDNAGILGDAFNFVGDPLTGAAERTSGLSSVLRRPSDLRTAQLEIEALRERINALERENEELRSLEAEFQRLQELLDRANETPNFTRVTASVIGRGPNPLFRDLIIDKGTNDGISVGMPVESSRGLVGQVFRSTPTSSQIVLITDTASAVPARLSQARAVGILEGGGVGGLMLMNWIDLEADPRPNEPVVTSGIDGTSIEERIANRFPEGLVIGRVVEVNTGQAELFKQVVVQPAVDFDAIETVFVITDFEPIDTSIFDSSDG